MRKQQQQQLRDEEEEEEEDERERSWLVDGELEEDEERFFESLDRVPSGVFFGSDIPSSSSDGEDEVRFSFASAIAPPSELQQRSDDDEEEVGGGQGYYDYGIWMSEPISIKERRHRLLQGGMGFNSSKDIPVEVVGGGRSFKLSSSVRITPPSSSSPHHVLLSRSRSDTELLLLRGPAGPRRASSAPSSLWVWDHPPAGEGGDDRDRLDSPPTTGGGGGVCRIKNLDTGKEFLVSELGKDGTWGRLNDLQTGSQLTSDEFESFLGYSPIVKELMRRVNLVRGSDKKNPSSLIGVNSSKSTSSGRRKGGWLKNIKFVASSVTGLISDKDRDPTMRMRGRRSSSIGGGKEWLKVHQHGKSYKDLTGLYMCQQIQAHQGSIWCIKFSSDSRYLASAGEDRVVHVWQVLQSDTPSSSSSLPNGSARLTTPPSRRMTKGKLSIPDYIVMSDTVFSLAEKPVCLFQGHLDDVLDLSWSKSQYLLSSSMDKTVRLWDMESKSCLKLFAHNDYVTCIQFNPIDDRYFISGSLDAKVRIWSIPDRQVVDWSDLHEMVTAVCYTPDGQGALVGSHKGSCRFYNTSDCKLNQESQMDIWNKKKKSHAKKITGFQFAPGNPSEVLITSADSQIRVFDGVDMIHKFRGFRNTSSQISASFTSDGRFVVCASEDSHVYVWKRDVGGGGGKSKGLITTRSNEHFYCKGVSVAIPCLRRQGTNCNPPSLAASSSLSGRRNHHHHHQQYSDSQRSTSTLEDIFSSSRSHCPPLPKKGSSEHIPPYSPEEQRWKSAGIGSTRSFFSSSSPSLRSDDASATSSSSSSSSWRWYSGGSGGGGGEAANAWGLVVVTAGLGGDIKIYQNFGLPLRLSRQTNLF